MPPEVVPGAKADPKMDIWCFGVVAYQLAVGYKPNVLAKLNWLNLVSRLTGHKMTGTRCHSASRIGKNLAQDS